MLLCYGTVRKKSFHMSLRMSAVAIMMVTALLLTLPFLPQKPEPVEPVHAYLPIHLS